MRMRSVVPWWAWLVWGPTVVAGVIAYPHLPTVVATHFDAAGQPNGFSSRGVAVVLVPGIALVIALLWSVLWRIDPKRANYPSFWPTYRTVGGLIIVFLCLTQGWLLGHALGVPGLSVRVVPASVGLLFVLLSNLCPRIQPNWWLGVRTPWTLSSEVSWRKTHRLAGHLGVVVGLLLAVFALVLPTSIVAVSTLVLISVWAGIVVLASYVYARQ
jgi:uncharacterized membrane protein